MGREEEVMNVSPFVIPQDLGKNGKRRVVDYDAAVRVFGFRVIRTGPKGADDRTAFYIRIALYPIQYRIIHAGWRITVVRRLFRLEFFHKAVVIVKFFFFLTHIVCFIEHCCYICDGVKGESLVRPASGRFGLF